MKGIFKNTVDVTGKSEEDIDVINKNMRKIRKDNGFETIFSMFDENEVLDYSLRALEGTHKIYFMGRFNNVDDKADAPFEILENPTWLEVWAASDKLVIKQEKDYRTDLYIELFDLDDDGDFELRVGS